jgi:hypothetical protein
MHGRLCQHQRAHHLRVLQREDKRRIRPIRGSDKVDTAELKLAMSVARSSASAKTE